ncbi:MAG: pknB [Glaciihabitans sp.]|nr:pknB [Glaciihabitans sp.]
MVGRLIDGRYQVRSRIARGGMATVYLATDLRLERRVAIKIMHGHLADDSAFKARFIQEARSAARLAHPNVVNVFDQGQDSDMAYLVMEYLPGITLRDLLQEHGKLTTEQTLDVLEAVLAGLSAAHKAGIVHRDLKPENVLLADDGRIKLGDFGLARAVSANTATGAALLGTIAYLSPELVTRGIADARSDIYAIGIMMYEMLTGEQPYKGEQPMQIAYQHANDSVPMPSTVNSRVPAELDELVLWATAREPDERPRDARVMLDQLVATQSLLATALPAGATVAQRTMVFPTAMPAAAAAETSATVSFLAPDTADQTMVIGPAKPPHPSGPIESDNSTLLVTKTHKRRVRGWWLMAFVLVLAALSGGTGWYFGVGPGGHLAVPEISDVSVDEATQTLVDAGFLVSSTTGDSYAPFIEPGRVVSTNPEPGVVVPKDDEVTLLVSIGPEPFEVPGFVGASESDAMNAIPKHFTVSTEPTIREFSDTVPPGVVIAALGEDGQQLGATYSDQRPIRLVVSLGSIPNVSDMSVSEAKATLAEAKLNATEGSQAYSDTIDEGRVISVDTSESSDGVVRENDSVRLTTSLGPKPVTIPQLEGETRAAATEALEALGLKVSYNPLFAPFPAATVDSTDPKAGASAAKGSTVTLYLQVFG